MATHTHDHTHKDGSHSHEGPAVEAPSGPSEGPVVLDIGGDIGALVVYTPQILDGEEIEIRPSGTDWSGRHVAVRARPGSHAVYAAVFPSLPEGTYELRLRPYPPGGIIHRTQVAGAQVAELQWGL
jgi:hypothetical protein